jgi:TPP-dependent pyruvate/acetoin dehydrogenase alpha subunit
MATREAPVTTAVTSVGVAIEPATARTWLGQMLLIRRFEEKAAELYSAGKIRGFLHLSIGEEAVSVAAMGALTMADNVVSTYREHGHALARGVPAGPLMAELFGKANGTSRGRGGSMHIFDVGRRFYGGNAIVGGGMPLAVGLALADRLEQRAAITACLFGDGAVAEGEFHESLNLASLWRLPVLFLCENNYYAMGTALDRHQAETDIQPEGSRLSDSFRRRGRDGSARHGRGGSACRGAGPEQWRTVPAGVPDLPLPGALHVRPGALPLQRRGGAVEAPRSDHPVPRPD